MFYIKYFSGRPGGYPDDDLIKKKRKKSVLEPVIPSFNSILTYMQHVGLISVAGLPDMPDMALNFVDPIMVNLKVKLDSKFVQNMMTYMLVCVNSQGPVDIAVLSHREIP